MERSLRRFYEAGSAFFHGQGDAAGFRVYGQDGDLYDIADADDLGGVADEAVGELRDMDEAVLMDADIDERTEVDHVAHGAGELHAGLQVIHIQDVGAEHRRG